MNSYQTLNAAAAAAGISKQSAVRFGRAFEEGQRYNTTRRLQPLGAPQFTGQFDRPIPGGLVLRDYADVEARVSAFQSEGWDERIASDKDRRRSGTTTGRWNAEDKARQLRVSAAMAAPYGRDQSEDRPAAKVIVVGQEHPKFGLVWYVARTADRVRTTAYTKQAEVATLWARGQEAGIADDREETSEDLQWDEQYGVGLAAVEVVRKHYRDQGLDL